MLEQTELVETGHKTMVAPLDSDRIEARTIEIGQQIFRDSRGGAFKVFNRNFWQNKFMELSMKDPLVKTQLFRFVDVLPVLVTDRQKLQHLLEYLSRPPSVESWPGLLSLVSGLLRLPLFRQLLMRLSDRQVRQMGNLFIVGRNATEALPKVLDLRSSGVGFTLDILGEAVVSDEESHHYQSQYEDLIDQLGNESLNWTEVQPVDFSDLGPVPKVNVSLKLSAFDALLDPMATDSSVERLKARLIPVLRLAMQRGVFINFDMEQFSLNSLTRKVFRQLILMPEFKSYRHFGIVCQAYLRSAEEEVREWIQLATERGTPFTIRLVKGAYWDYETIIAEQNDWESPVFSEKWESDQAFESCARLLLGSYPKIEMAAGSHNVRSLSYCLALAEELKLPRNSFEIQMLYGMSGSFKDAILRRKLRLREYCPLGEMLPGLSYLVRRLLENTANDSFLRQSFMDRKAMELLLRRPGWHLERQKEEKKKERKNGKDLKSL
ncbi:MAG: hypothetical protein EA369_05690 [Bradymonadales bacterium]|nr:MAG: hypothetical protein EA369_05690 [Bradymonadales bacterium]